MRNPLIACAVLLLSACTNQSPLPPTPDAADLPPVGVVITRINESVREECIEVNKSPTRGCRINAFETNDFAQALSATGRFESVAGSSAPEDYQILISTAHFSGLNARGFANVIASSATLMIIPMVGEVDLKTEYIVTWRGHEVDRFTHEIPVRYTSSLYTGLTMGEEEIAAALAGKLVESIDANNSLSVKRLHGALESSDYEADLEIPERVGSFRQTDREVSRDPFSGAMIRFNHKDFGFDRADVFVYPIRATDWRDQRKTIENELDNVRAEIRYFEQEGFVKEVNLHDPEISEWSIDSNNRVVGFMDGYYLRPEYDKSYTAVYIFIEGDKFVKVRASFPETEEGASAAAPDDFVRELIQSITVPEESLFMARLRKQHRETTIYQEDQSQ